MIKIGKVELEKSRGTDSHVESMQIREPLICAISYLAESCLGVGRQEEKRDTPASSPIAMLVMLFAFIGVSGLLGKLMEFLRNIQVASPKPFPLVEWD